MRTTLRPFDFDVPVALIGGVRRDVSSWLEPGGGFWTLKGMHTNEKAALTKWAGMERFSSINLGGKVRGLFQAVLNGVTYYFVMTPTKVVRVAGATLSDMVTGQSDAYYSGLTLGSLFFFCSGVNPNQKVTSALSVQNNGIAAPTDPGTVLTDGGVGVLTGSYTYKVTFRNSVTGHESDPSPASNILTITTRQINLNNIPVSSDPQVDRKKLYRTTGTNSGQWFFDAEIANATTAHTSNKPDAQLAEQVFEDNGIPPQAKYVEEFNGMLAYAGLASPLQNYVALSGVLRPEAVDVDNRYGLAPDEQDVITGLKKFGRLLVAAKKHKIWVGTGFGPDEMDFTPTQVSQGPLGHWGIIEYRSALWYPSEQGFQVWGGLQEEYIGRPIEDLYKTLDLAMLEKASGVFYPPLNMLIWNVQTAGQPDFDQWLIYNVATREWTHRDHASSKLGIYLDNLNRSKLWIGGVNGFLYTGDTGNADDGTNIAVEVVTRGIALARKGKIPDLDALYTFRRVSFLYDPNGGISLVSVSYCMDSPDGPFVPMVHKTTGLSTFAPGSGTRASFDLEGVGRLIFIKFTLASQESFKLRSIQVEGNLLGRR